MNINQGMNRYENNLNTGIQPFSLLNLNKTITLGHEIQGRLVQCKQDFQHIQDVVKSNSYYIPDYADVDFPGIIVNIETLIREFSNVTQQLSAIATGMIQAPVSIEDLSALDERMKKSALTVEELLSENAYLILLDEKRRESLLYLKQTRIEKEQKNDVETIFQDVTDLVDKMTENQDIKDKQIQSLKKSVTEQIEELKQKDEVIEKQNGEIKNLKESMSLEIAALAKINLEKAERSKTLFVEEHAQWKILQRNILGLQDKELADQVEKKVVFMEILLKEMSIDSMDRTLIGFQRERKEFQERYEELMQKEQDKITMASSTDKGIAAEDFSELKEEMDKPGFFHAFSKLKKHTMARLVGALGLAAISLSASTFQSISESRSATAPVPLKMKETKKIEPKKSVIAVVQKESVVQQIQIPTQAELKTELSQAVDHNPLQNASIGSYTPTDMVYAGNWTVSTLASKNPKFDKMLNSFGGARSVKPVGYFYTAEGIKKVEGVQYANGHMGVQSAWGKVPMSFTLEVEFNSGKRMHVGVGTMVKPVTQKVELAQHFVAPEITKKKVENPHKDLDLKIRNGMQHISQEADAGKAKGIFGKIGMMGKNIKEKVSGFFG